MYKFEIHLHTSSCSACALSTIKEMIDSAIANDYSGFVVTNHFFHGNTCIDRQIEPKEFIKAYVNDYYIGKEYAEKHNITVLFGIEEVYSPLGKEMLLYGLDPEILLETPDFIQMNAFQKAEFTREIGGIVVAAHPFRTPNHIPNPSELKLFDGIECYNHNNIPKDNVPAFVLAKNNGLIMTAGGDVHKINDFGFSGVDFNEKINNNQDFISALKNGNYKLIHPLI